MIFELRQYTLHPGARDTLIELFEREFVESQEELGMRLVGQFRDLDDPDRYVWIRGFENMDTRLRALTGFYYGPVWQRHREAANATLIDSDDVLLLREIGTGFPVPDEPRPATGSPAESLVTATICQLPAQVDDEFVRFFAERVEPALAEAGSAPLALLSTEYADNTFPALPVRTGEHAFVWFTRYASPDDHRASVEKLAGLTSWPAVRGELTARLAGPPAELRLAPTDRSLLR